MSLSQSKGLQALGVLRQAWPVGSVFLSVVSTDPATLLGFGTWTQIAGGKFLVGQTGADVDFDTAEETGGSKTSAALLAHTHGITDPGHNHTQNAHTHTQNSHTHTSLQVQGGTTASTAGTHIMTSTATGGSSRAATSPEAANSATATNQNATATNNATTTGITATDSAGSGASFPILPPYLVVYIWKRTA